MHFKKYNNILIEEERIVDLSYFFSSFKWWNVDVIFIYSHDYR